MTDTPEVLAALRSAGWAPGLYVFRCRYCGADSRSTPIPEGAKWSWRCRPCAEKVVAARKEDAAALVAMVADTTETIEPHPDSEFPHIPYRVDKGRVDKGRVATDTPDTGSEAVENLARWVEGATADCVESRIAATLRTLAAERDKLMQVAGRLQEAYDNASAAYSEADSARAAAIARAERLEADCEAAAVAVNEMKAERDALVRVAEAARRERRVDMDGRSTPDTRAAARQALDEAVDALPSGHPVRAAHYREAAAHLDRRAPEVAGLTHYTEAEGFAAAAAELRRVADRMEKP